VGKRSTKRRAKITDLTPKELLEEIAKTLENSLDWLDEEYSEAVNLDLDPPLFYSVSLEIITKLCRYIVSEEDKDKLDKCVEVAEDIIDELEDKYNEPFVRAWIKVYYVASEEMFKELVEALKRMPKFEKDRSY